jgi:curved DNA-binding protein
VGDFFNEGGGVSDFFERVFGSTSSKGAKFNQTQQTKKNKPTPKKGKNYQTEIILTLQEAFGGTTRVLNVNGERIEVKFKKGIADGHSQKISGKGYQSTNPDGKNGDLIIKTKIQPHPSIERKGNDLYTDAPCDLYTAILGGNIVANTFFDTFKITVPANSQNGKVFKLSNQGMPIYHKDENRGNLYVTIKIILPTNLTEKESNIFRELKELRNQ